MAISRHKVLSEMQQQLELASSKCGNLQKQLEIVKDKVRQSSTTNLVRTEHPENKENKTKTGESLETTETNKETDYSQALSISSSSSEEANEERDVNIIKVFYDRLGQMDYQKSQVELSDISSVDNDLDIDQLLSSVNFSMRSNEGRKNKRDKKVVKKGKDKMEKAGNQKWKTTKGKIGVKNLSPYENTSTKLFKQIPAKKNTKAKTLKTSESLSSTTGYLGNKPASQGQAKKAEADKMKKKKQVGSVLPVAKNNSRKIFQEPIKRVVNLANQLRKTKSSTLADKRDSFADTRSLTRLHSVAAPTPALEESKEEKVSLEQHLEPPKSKITEESTSPEKIKLVSPKMKSGAVGRGPNRMARNEIRVLNRENGIKPKVGEDAKISQQDKGTSLSDLATRANPSQKPEVEIPNKSRSATPNAHSVSLKSMDSAASVKLMKRTDFKSRRSFDVKVPNTNRETRGPERKPWPIRKPVKLEDRIARVETGDVPDKPKNGIVSYSGQEMKPAKTEVKKRVDLFEKVSSKEKEIFDVTSSVEKKERPTSKYKGGSVAITRTNTSSTYYDDVSRKGLDSLRPTSSVNTVPPSPALRGAGDYREKDPADVKTLTITQIKKMKDNLMKFNTIPFIVGQSTSKSYHIGLNIQETYSLFKQTPSMTALMGSKHADQEHQSVHSRARSSKTGYSGRRSLSSGRGRETCPACEPTPERSPEQLADPWAVPQDEEAVVRVCTCLPKRMISFDQVLNQLYFSNMNLVKLHPTFLPKDGIIEESEAPDGKERPVLLPHRPTNTLYYTKLLRSIQNLKDNIKG